MSASRSQKRSRAGIPLFHNLPVKKARAENSALKFILYKDSDWQGIYRVTLCDFACALVIIKQLKFYSTVKFVKRELELLIATKNAGKIRELKELLADVPVVLRSLNDFENVFEPEETGASFAENAALKAKSYALQTRLWALADDSGLEVAALGGAPGIFSARYAGADAGDGEKIEKLLNNLNKINDAGRRARFVCAAAISDEKGEIQFQTTGVCDGKIAAQPAGTNGFGYDPIFVPDGFTETFGEISADVKRKISHRAKAIGKIIAFLRGFIAT